MRHDSCENIVLLSSEQREDGAAGCISVTTPLSLEDARRLVAEFVAYYNTVRLHSAIAYITPVDKLAGHAEAIWAAQRQNWQQPTTGGEPRPRTTKWTRPSAVMYTDKAWAEDRATRGRDLSADPGPRPEGRQEAARTPAPRLAPKR